MRALKTAIASVLLTILAAFGASWDSLSFPIMGWYGPTPDIATAAVFQDMIDAGFTANFSGGSRTDNLRMLRIAHGAGIKLLISDSRINPSEPVDSAALRRLDSVIIDYKDSVALLGYHLIDEPNAAIFGNIAAIKAYLNEKDPDRLAYVNLFPTYASNDQLGSPSYQAHVDDYMRLVRPQVLSYDHYGITTGGLRSDYYQNLEIIRNAAMTSNVPFWAFTLSQPHWSFPMPTEGHIRFQLCSDLAYGAKGLQYFTYCAYTPLGSMAPITASGVKTVVWTMAQSVNNEILQLAPVLKRLTSINVYHSLPLPQGTQGLPADFYVNSVSGGALVVGYFKDTSDAPYIMLVNRDYTNSANMTLSGSVDSMIEISKQTGLELPALAKDINHHVSLQFTAGEGRLFRIVKRANLSVPALDSLSFPIMAWWGPPAGIVNDTVFQDMVDAGFTANLTFASRDENLMMLRVAHKAGLKLSVYDSRIDPRQPVDSAAFRRLDSVIADYKDSAAFLGYHIIDEPSAAIFNNIAAIKAYLNEKDPDHLAYVNLFPNYASTGQLGSSSYQAHVDDYMSIVQPQMLSYDFYCITTGGFRSGYYENLEIIRNAAMSNNVPFWAFTLSTPHWSFPTPTEGHIRFQLYSDLAYGAKGLQYFTYGLPPSDASITFFQAPINPDGSKTPIWDMARNVNREILRLAPVLKKLTSVNVYHSLPLPQGTRGLPSDFHVSAVSGGTLVVGSFTDSSGAPYLMLVNRDYANGASMVLSGSVDTMAEISKETGLELPITAKDAGNHIPLQFTAGEGRLFRIISTETSIIPSQPNMALGKTVNASSSYESSEWGASKLTDGVQTSIPGARGYTTECTSPSQVQAWVQVDLGADTLFNRVILYPRLTSESAQDSAYLNSGSLPFPVDFTLFAITAAGDTLTAMTLTGYPNTDKYPLTLDFTDVRARYIRLFSTNFGSDGDCLRMQLAELEVYKRLITDMAGSARPGHVSSIIATPNPFNPSVTVHFVLPPGQCGRYQIFNTQGKLLFQKELPNRASKLVWNGTDLSGKKAPSGLYIGRLGMNGAKTISHRLLLLK